MTGLLTTFRAVVGGALAVGIACAHHASVKWRHVRVAESGPDAARDRIISSLLRSAWVDRLELVLRHSPSDKLNEHHAQEIKSSNLQEERKILLLEIIKRKHIPQSIENKIRDELAKTFER